MKKGLFLVACLALAISVSGCCKKKSTKAPKAKTTKQMNSKSGMKKAGAKAKQPMKKASAPAAKGMEAAGKKSGY